MAKINSPQYINLFMALIIFRLGFGARATAPTAISVSATAFGRQLGSALIDGSGSGPRIGSLKLASNMEAKYEELLP